MFVLTTTNEIASFQIKSKNEKLIFVFPQNYAHRFWDNIFQNLFYSIGRNLIIFERILKGDKKNFFFLFKWKKKVVEKFKLTINSIYHIFLVFEFTKDVFKINNKFGPPPLPSHYSHFVIFWLEYFYLFKIHAAINPIFEIKIKRPEKSGLFLDVSAGCGDSH